MSTTVSKDKIYNLLMSQDLECRILGLSYLGKDKNNPNLAIRYDLMTSSYYVYDMKSPIKIHILLSTIFILHYFIQI